MWRIFTVAHDGKLITKKRNNKITGKDSKNKAYYKTGRSRVDLLINLNLVILIAYAKFQR